MKGKFNIQEDKIHLSLIILLGTALRLYNLGTESFWFDEIYTVYVVPQDLQTLIRQIATQGNVTRNAVYYLLAHFWVLPFEITEVSIRSLSVMFGVLAIGTMYLVGRELFGTKVGLISAFLMAVSEFQIQYSQEARFYSLFVLFSLLSIYYYLLTLKTRHSWLWTISVLINTLLFYTHTYAIFVFAAEYIHYLIYWKQHKNTLFQWILAQVLLFLAILASFVPVIREGELDTGFGAGLSWITSPSLKDLLRTVYDYLFPQNYQHSWVFIAASFAAALAFFVFCVFLFNFRKLKEDWFVAFKNWLRIPRIFPQVGSEFVLVVLWFVCPILLPFIYSNIFSPVYQDRYTICAAPAFYLLIATAILRIHRMVPVYITLFALMIVVLPGLQDYYVTDVNEQWREAAAYVQENAQSNDVVVYTDEDGFQQKSFDWYYVGKLSGCGLNLQIRDAQVFEDAISNCTVGHERFWVIIRGPSEVVNRFKSFFLNPDQTYMHLIKESQLVGISVYLFETAK